MSFQITLPRHKRDAARFVGNVTRGLQRALAEEAKKRRLKQSDIARTIGVDRATINRQIHGRQNVSLARVGEIASAMGRDAVVSFPEPVATGNRPPDAKASDSGDTLRLEKPELWSAV